jgi:EmrB/QacA subfamily drug resistance transporter
LSERQHYNITLGILTLAGIAFALQQTMVIPALPALQRDLHTTTGWATWLLTGFLLTASVATPLIGKLGDQYGKKRLLVISLGIFFVGCVGAAAAPNIWVLIAFRMVQGTGGAVFPLSFSIIKDEFPPEKVGVAVGIVSSVFAVGGGLGLVLSGLIVDHLSWRWLFIVGALGVGIAAVFIHRFVPESPVKTESRVDLLGAALLSVGLICLLLALTEGEGWGWLSGRIVGLFAGAAVALLAWALVELRIPDPMVDKRMLAHRPVLLTNLTAMIAGFAMFGSFVLIPNFVEAPTGLSSSVAAMVHYGFGATSTQAGLYLLPGALSGFFSGPLAGILGKRYGSKWPLALGMLMASGGITVLAIWHSRPWHIVLGMFVLGAGVPAAFAAMAKLIVDAVRPTETGVATGVNTVMRTIGGVIGGQVGAAILTAETIRGTHVPTEGAFATAFWMSAVAAFVGAVLALFVTPLRRADRALPIANRGVSFKE